MYYFCCKLWLTLRLKEEGLFENNITIGILSFLSIKLGSIWVKNCKHLRSPFLSLPMLFCLTHLLGNFSQIHCFKCHLDIGHSNVYVQSGTFYWTSHTNTKVPVQHFKLNTFKAKLWFYTQLYSSDNFLLHSK